MIVKDNKEYLPYYQIFSQNLFCLVQCRLDNYALTIHSHDKIYQLIPNHNQK